MEQEFIISDQFDGRTRKLYKFNCKICNKPKYVPKSRLAKSSYCSFDCSAKAQETPLKLVCSRCKETKSPEDFHKKRKKLSPYCKLCQKLNWKEWYANKSNADRHRVRNKTRKKIEAEKIKSIIVQYKNKPCKDCNVRYQSWIMQFDHVSDNKEFTISEVRSITIEKLIKEIEKCEVVCANCHADRTHKRMMQSGAIV